MVDRIDRRQFAAALLAPALVRALPSIGHATRRQSVAPFAINPPGADFMKGLAGMMDTSGVPGVTMCVVQERRVVWQHGQGVMDVASRHPVGADTVWPAASLGKPVFAFAALHLVDKGKLDLDRPLKSYVPEHAPDDARGNKITARHVLSHSSGLRNWRNRADQPLVPDFEPGARFQYSGEGYYYLQRVVERITGRGFEQFMEDELLTPLGMKSSTYAWRDDLAARLVTGHDQGQPRTNFSKDFAAALSKYAEQKGKPLASFSYDDVIAAMQTITPAPAPLPNFMIPNAAATLLTTAADYSKFLIELLNGGTAGVDLEPATRDAMLAQQTRVNGALGWGLGWGLERQESGAAFLWHWGDNGNWKNFVLAHPPTRSAIVIFTNGSRGLNVAQRVVAAATGQDHAAFLWL